MGNVLLLVAVIAIVSTLVWLVVRAWNQPDRRLKRDFKKLRKMIEANLRGPNEQQAERLLDDCEKHLDKLIAAKEQQHVLADMANTTKELTKRDVSPMSQAAVQAFDDRVAEQLSQFFTSLTRISTITALQEDEAVRSLREFADDLVEQRQELVRLTIGLTADDARAELEQFTIPEAEQDEESAKVAVEESTT